MKFSATYWDKLNFSFIKEDGMQWHIKTFNIKQFFTVTKIYSDESIYILFYFFYIVIFMCIALEKYANNLFKNKIFKLNHNNHCKDADSMMSWGIKVPNVCVLPTDLCVISISRLSE